MIDTRPIQRDVIRNAKQRARMHSANVEDQTDPVPEVIRNLAVPTIKVER
jgi:hypothetical protein